MNFNQTDSYQPSHPPNQTVEELQQTLVEGLKAGREDGKLTKEEIASLGEALLDGTIAKKTHLQPNSWQPPWTPPPSSRAPARLGLPS